MTTFLKVLFWICAGLIALMLAPVVLPLIFTIFMIIVSLLASLAMFIFGGFMWLVASLFAFLGG